MGVAVVTGASRGLGAGLTATFAAAGHAVGVCARNQPATPPGGLAREVDVADAAAVEAFAAAVHEQLGPIDLWVNNAGVLAPVGPLRDADPEAVAEHLRVNVLGVVHGTQSFLRHRATDGAVLVNISSGAAARPYEGWGPYCASKAAVDMLTEVVTREEPAIRAYAVAPGVVDTDMQVAVRATPADRFPAVARFRELKAREAFNSPTWVGEHLLALAFGGLEPGTRWRVPDEPSS